MENLVLMKEVRQVLILNPNHLLFASSINKYISCRVYNFKFKIMELILIILTVLNAVCITALIVLLQNIKKTASLWMYRIYLFFTILALLFC